MNQLPSNLKRKVTTMFNKLSPIMRNGLATIIILAVPALFIIALIIGNREEELPLQEEIEEVAEGTVEVEAEAAPVQEYDGKEVADDAEPIALPDEEDKAAAAELAREFIAEFHRVDTAAPFLYLEGSKPFMTDKLYEEYKDIPKRGTLNTVTAEAVALEAMPAELESDRQVWAVYVTSEETAADGVKTRVFNGYSVLMVKEGQDWKVDGVRADEY